MKYKINSWMILCFLSLVLMFVQVKGFTADLQEQDAIIAQLQQPKKQYITLNEDFTLIRTSDDYIYLSSLTINRDIWESATRQTDINGVTWYEIMQDGYIKVYCEGHIPPHEVHWYAAY